MKKKAAKATALLLAVCMAAGMTGCGGKNEENTENKAEGFQPSLDTEKETILEIAGFMGNFEALDQVVNNFNEVYPNVTVTYEQNNNHMLVDYIENNDNVDIFMTTDENVRDTEPEEDYVGDICEPLSQEEIDFTAIQTDILKAGTVDGKLLCVPITLNPYGMVINKTLLKKEGLSVPQNYEEFLDVLEKLKNKGYTPVQGAAEHVYGEVAVNMMMNMVSEDQELLKALESGDTAALEKVQPVFERIQVLMDNGYTDYEKNSEYPSDNYDGSIMSFFEGDMPFWICTAECFSGMKKRESKSETFSKEPFDYEFQYAPFGDEGAYAYTEPWYGFSVNRNSDQKDYALEFIRFLVQKDQIDTLASIKGMPSVAVDGENERYQAFIQAKNIQADAVDDGSVPNKIGTAFTETAAGFGAGEYKDAGEAAEAFVENCGK